MKRLLSCLTLALALTAVQAGPASSRGDTAEDGATATVVINHFKFHPRTLNVARGTKVVFANSSKVTHTATKHGVFDTRRIEPGDSVAVRFKQKGTFRYHCKIHAFMHGKIVVG
jgi:plastocyanin